MGRGIDHTVPRPEGEAGCVDLLGACKGTISRTHCKDVLGLLSGGYNVD